MLRRWAASNKVLTWMSMECSEMRTRTHGTFLSFLIFLFSREKNFPSAFTLRKSKLYFLFTCIFEYSNSFEYLSASKFFLWICYFLFISLKKLLKQMFFVLVWKISNNFFNLQKSFLRITQNTPKFTFSFLRIPMFFFIIIIICFFKS